MAAARDRDEDAGRRAVSGGGAREGNVGTAMGHGTTTRAQVGAWEGGEARRATRASPAPRQGAGARRGSTEPRAGEVLEYYKGRSGILEGKEVIPL